MVFKRRDRRPWYKAFTAFLWPKGGWNRAFHYVKHRLNRLPDPPHRIARGIFAGVCVSFTPIFGLHFIAAALLAKVMRANIMAALLATFFGNPLTFVPIAALSLNTGYFLLGMQTPVGEMHRSLGGKFADAGTDLWHNLIAMFTPETSDWSHLALFYHDVFLPYLLGGVVHGSIFGLGAYYLSLPVIRAYQNRRKGVLRAKLAALKLKRNAKSETD